MNDIDSEIEPLQIEPLKKVTLSLEAGATPDAMNLTPTPLSFDFVFGVGAGGWTSFEYALAGKREGDEASLLLKPGEACSLPGNTPPSLLQKLQAPGDLYLKATILRIQSADNREVIRAMAGSSGCGGSCDGDCCGHEIPG
ncbi:MAG: hypothetical protein GY859_17500 [Desulfobacterales bacterium]|nr:hypothetical protein [Desulfobacterales bacterium]